MSIKELERLEVVKKCVTKALSQSNVSRQLIITSRHLPAILSETSKPLKSMLSF